MSDVNAILEMYENVSKQPRRMLGPDGTISWRLNDRLHREDGPAVVYANGTKVWHYNGLCHRIGAPAFVGHDGYKAWYVNGKRHNADGPAIEDPDGHKEWWVNNKMYDDVYSWAEAALEYEGKKPTKENIEQKIAQVMQQDLFD